jgi:group II intron reverse transcriptase/maturase
VKPVGELQDSLYRAAKADRRKVFYSLKDKICRTDVLYEAWGRVRKNGGAAGVDRETIQDIEHGGVGQFLSDIQRELLTETYWVEPVRRVFIPKPDGRQRPLGIPTVRDRVVQQAVRLIIEPIFEADFHEFSYGYRPNKSAQQATDEVYRFLNYGLTGVVDADIQGFFDHVNHTKLLSFVRERIADGFVIGLVRKWLKAGAVYLDNSVQYPEEGTPQGGVISPLLANIYLNRLDAQWTERKMDDRRGYDAHMVRYADDMVILTSQRNVQHAMAALSGLLAGLDLKLSEEKSRTVDATKEGFDFLGFRFIRRLDEKRVGGGGGGRMVTRVFPSKKSTRKFREKARMILDTRASHLKDEGLAVRQLNFLLVGWGNYFNHSNASKAFRHLQRFIEWKLMKFISVRHKRPYTSMGRESIELLYDTLGLKQFPRVRYVR